MSQDDPNNAGMPEDSPSSEDGSRRRFLIGGAMAAVGALASAGVPKAAEAQGACPSGGQPIGVKEPNGNPAAIQDYSPNDTLATMIVNAWASNDYANELLNNTVSAFRREGFRYSNPNDVTVLTWSQYCNPGHTKARADQAVFVLPDKPSGLYIALERARVMMQVTPFGM